MSAPIQVPDFAYAFGPSVDGVVIGKSKCFYILINRSSYFHPIENLRITSNIYLEIWAYNMKI